jgi:coatomer protein complex subunit epsilon
LGQTEDVLSDIAAEADDVPDLAAVKALAQQVAGNTEEALVLAQKLAETESENATVQVLASTVLQAQGQTEEALALLGKHQGNLEA